MRLSILTLIFTIVALHELGAQTVFELDTEQSMIMTGKGPGQDGTINPFYGQDCYAIIENIGQLKFSIRVQQGNSIIEEISILEGETKTVRLLKDYQLYLDPNPEGKTKARVDYKK